MTSERDIAEIPDAFRRALERTPARLMVGRAGPAYLTRDWLKLRADHAVARDAVMEELDFARDLGALAATLGLYEVATEARDRVRYIARPGEGRRLSTTARGVVMERTRAGADLLVAVGDGLSSRAVATQVPRLLPELAASASADGWSWATPMFIRQCRVGVMNELGEILGPRVLILLIGERPGLATAESLSAYMAFRPKTGQTDADRNLISNIHARGIPIAEAANRIMNLAKRMAALGQSGVAVKETVPGRLAHVESRQR